MTAERGMGIALGIPLATLPAGRRGAEKRVDGVALLGGRLCIE
jgi:hypothetical protein